MQDNIIYILSIYNRQCRNIYLPEKDSAYTQKVRLFTSVKIFIKNEDLLSNTENPHLFKSPHKICPNFQTHITLIRHQYFLLFILLFVI